MDISLYMPHEQTAIKEGIEAQRMGLIANESNPYPRTSPEHNLYMLGWMMPLDFLPIASYASYEQAIIRAGWAANTEGKAPYMNPYLRGQEAWMLWLEGWCMCERTRSPSKRS